MEVLSTRAIPLQASVDELVKEKAFYGQKFYFSYSSLSKLLRNPQLFYREYVLKKKEKKTDKHLIGGKVIHALLLSKDQFDAQFVIMPGKLPGENSKKIADKIYELHRKRLADIPGYEPMIELQSYRQDIMSVLKEMKLHQSLVDDKASSKLTPLKTGDDKRMEKVLSDEVLEYWDYLLKNQDRDVIDMEIYSFCELAAEKVRQVPAIMERMGYTAHESANIEVFNEQLLRYDLKNYPFGINGVIDNLVIDHDQRRIYINDVKSISKDLNEFRESLEKYQYWIQAVMYVLLVLRNYPQLSAQGYEVEFRFIVIDRNQHVYAFPVTKQTMNVWTRRFHRECLFKANYHYTQKQFSLPYEFAEELIVL